MKRKGKGELELRSKVMRDDDGANSKFSHEVPSGHGPGSENRPPEVESREEIMVF
jgi:hypothetical protein